jgi:CheY-like chemotaxis protein
MRKHGPVVIVDDDVDDQLFYSRAFNELGYQNEIVFFTTGAAALVYLRQAEVVPFIVISDINMPGMNGFELRNHLLHDPGLSEKCTPYIFFSTSTSQRDVAKAYGQSIQGYFVKPGNMAEIKGILELVFRYWQACSTPFGSSLN